MDHRLRSWRVAAALAAAALVAAWLGLERLDGGDAAAPSRSAEMLRPSSSRLEPARPDPPADDASRRAVERPANPANSRAGEPGSVWTLRVVRAEDGGALAGASVDFRDASHVTDEDGRTLLSVPSDEEPHWRHVDIEAEGRVRCTLSVGAWATEAEARLERGVRFRGRLVGFDLSEGCRVRFEQPDPSSHGGPRTWNVRLAPGESELESPWVRAGVPLELRIKEHPNVRPSLVREIVVEGGEVLTFELPRSAGIEGRIEGRVVDRSPHARKLLAALYRSDELDPRSRATLLRVERGAFAFTQVELGCSYRVLVLDADRAVAASDDLLLEATTPVQEIELVAEPALPRAALRIRALDAAGAPLANVWVEAEPIGASESPFAGRRVRGATTPDGELRLGALAPGRYALTTSGGTVRDSVRVVELAAGAETSLEFVLDPAGTLHGKLRTSSGSPVAETLLRARSVDPRQLSVCVARTDPVGEFELRGLGDGPWIVETAGRPGVAGGHRFAPIAAGTEEVELVLPEPCRVRGRWNPAPTAHVLWLEICGADLEREGMEGALARDGSFELAVDPRSEPVMLCVGVPDHGRAAFEGIRLDGGGRVDLGELSSASARALSGIVLDPEGVPVGEARVVLSREPWTDLANAVTGVDGRFRIEYVPGVACFLQVHVSGFRCEPLELADPRAAGEIVLRLAREPALVVKVAWDRAARLGRPEIAAVTLDESGELAGDSVSTVPDPSGRARFLGLPLRVRLYARFVGEPEPIAGPEVTLGRGESRAVSWTIP